MLSLSEDGELFSEHEQTVFVIIRHAEIVQTKIYDDILIILSSSGYVSFLIFDEPAGRFNCIYSKEIADANVSNFAFHAS